MSNDSPNHRRIALPSQPWKGALAIDDGDNLLNRIAVTDPPVFLWKDQHSDTLTIDFARVVHQKSRFAEHPFITVSCQANPQSSWQKAMGQLELLGSLETMNVSTEIDIKTCVPGGTLYIDEITALPGELQRGLLALIDHDGLIRFVRANGQGVEARVITTSSIKLWNTQDSETFRPDLFFRLNVLALHVPSQIECNEDS